MPGIFIQTGEDSEVISFDPDIIVYPNPSSVIVYIRMPEAVQGKVQVRDLADRIIFERKSFAESGLRIELEHKGTYLLSIRSDKFSSTRLIIIK